ncbi:hypothetical protein CAEBREN_13076, partial [Caenorhabditis brenneri]
ASCSHLQLLP